MTYWAILSGIEGNLTAYETVLADIKKQKIEIEEIYILGDIIGLHPDSNKVIDRLQNPRKDELTPHICSGWWEEQCFILHSLSSDLEPIELKEKYGVEAIELLWKYVDRSAIQWLRSLEFGFFELDCLLIHASTVSASDELTPNTSPIILLDRLQRMNANNLFCGRSGLAFQYHLESGSIDSEIISLDDRNLTTININSQRQIIGVGSVGRRDNLSTYTLYNPDRNKIIFRKI
jgi:diadenosine tetraphosphatase ApaH/serine/threonine PP2A family protein phosphatase